jgi:cell division protein FtsW
VKKPGLLQGILPGRRARPEPEPAMARPDRWLLIPPLGLTAVGLVLVYSASSILGLTQHGDAFFYVSRQAMRAVVGVLAFVFFARLDYHKLGRASWLLYGGVLLGLLAMAALGLGHEARGAKRWVSVLGMAIQPTELARVVVVLFLSAFLARRADRIESLTGAYLPALALLGAACALVAIQPNLSSAAVLFAVGAALLFFAGARWLHLGGTAGLGACGFVAMIVHYEYQRERLLHHIAFLFTGKIDSLGSGWQLEQSLIAIGSGGLFGRGFGRGMQKFLFLPDPHTDFILAIAGEEGGLIATAGLLAALLLLVWRAYRAGLRAPDLFGTLVAAGLATQLALYSFVNMGVATGLLPTTGLPLPFISYGGSALVMNLAAAGILVNISRQAEAVAGRSPRSRILVPTGLARRPKPTWEALK